MGALGGGGGAMQKNEPGSDHLLFSMIFFFGDEYAAVLLMLVTIVWSRRLLAQHASTRVDHHGCSSDFVMPQTRNTIIMVPQQQTATPVCVLLSIRAQTRPGCVVGGCGWMYVYVQPRRRGVPATPITKVHPNNTPTTQPLARPTKKHHILCWHGLALSEVSWTPLIRHAPGAVRMCAPWHGGIRNVFFPWTRMPWIP